MSSAFRVFAGMPVWRAIAAERHAAFLARAQVHPLVPGLHAFLAFLPLWRFHFLNRTQMLARFRYGHTSAYPQPTAPKEDPLDYAGDSDLRGGALRPRRRLLRSVHPHHGPA